MYDCIDPLDLRGRELSVLFFILFKPLFVLGNRQSPIEWIRRQSPVEWIRLEKEMSSLYLRLLHLLIIIPCAVMGPYETSALFLPSQRREVASF
jgi:hypothetical protein